VGAGQRRNVRKQKKVKVDRIYRTKRISFTLFLKNHGHPVHPVKKFFLDSRQIRRLGDAGPGHNLPGCFPSIDQQVVWLHKKYIWR